MPKSRNNPWISMVDLLCQAIFCATSFIASRVSGRIPSIVISGRLHVHRPPVAQPTLVLRRRDQVAPVWGPI